MLLNDGRCGCLLLICQVSTQFGIGLMQANLRNTACALMCTCSTHVVQEYWEMYDKHPHLQGGFIWDWVDQGLINTAQAPSGLLLLPSHTLNPEPLVHELYFIAVSCLV